MSINLIKISMSQQEVVTQQEIPTIQEEPVLSTHFKSISDIVDDPMFVFYVKKIMDELRVNRLKRSAPKAGYKYKRDWYDRMSSEGNFNFNFFIGNIESIWLKKSLLSSQERNVIQFVCDKAYQQTLIEYSKKVDAKDETV